jgi:hypothetical protein
MSSCRGLSKPFEHSCLIFNTTKRDLFGSLFESSSFFDTQICTFEIGYLLSHSLQKHPLRGHTISTLLFLLQIFVSSKLLHNVLQPPHFSHNILHHCHFFAFVMLRLVMTIIPVPQNISDDSLLVCMCVPHPCQYVQNLASSMSKMTCAFCVCNELPRQPTNHFPSSGPHV